MATARFAKNGAQPHEPCRLSSEHAERTLGHAIEGIEGVYDVHEYKAEKADALRRLTALIDAIVIERSADVLPLKGKARSHDPARNTRRGRTAYA